ncbi:MAG: glycosyltransferase [Chitinophagaceae bacterium]
MLLSVIIVNYNVKHFLEQCLYSVQKALREVESEVIVIDNNSTDGSVSFLQTKFANFHFVANTNNIGFGKACNQGYEISRGEYVLFLNPDTIVPEDCFLKCISFLSTHSEAGALGIRMVDGRGIFLKESKRAFPSPLTALFKLFGLSALFPNSKTFGKYHLQYLPELENNAVDVLAGAFMMIKRTVLEKVGAFDETFFMYAEDIDLSYRIQKAGFKNYYFSESTIIHFKGESTRKLTLNYVRMFYSAMNVFVKKHYAGTSANAFNFIIHIAIWFRAALSAIGKFIEKMGLPLIDAIFILLSFILAKTFWSTFVRPDLNYNIPLFWLSVPAFTVIYLLVSYYTGLYDRHYKRSRLIPSSVITTITLLAVYSLLPEKFRFSRAIVLLSGFLSFVLISLIRFLFVRWKILKDNRETELHPKTLIAATQNEFQKIAQLMTDAGLEERVIGRISVEEHESNAVGNWKNIKELTNVFSFGEIIYCAGSLSFHSIIESLQQLPGNITAKFHTFGSQSIVGSDSKDVSGETFTKENGYKLSDPNNRRLKRLIDVALSLLFLVTFPFHFFLVKKPFSFIKNCFLVLIGSNTWIGYAVNEKFLPEIRAGIMASNGTPLTVQQQFPEESLRMADRWYARDYDPLNELKMIFRVYNRLGG